MTPIASLPKQAQPAPAGRLEAICVGCMPFPTGPGSSLNREHRWLGKEPHTLHSKCGAECADSVTAPPTQAVGNVGVEGIPVELVLKSERQEAMDRIKAEYPNLIMIDYTLPQSVNGELYGSLLEGCCSMHQAAWKCPSALQHTMNGKALFVSVLNYMLYCSVCVVGRCLKNIVAGNALGYLKHALPQYMDDAILACAGLLGLCCGPACIWEAHHRSDALLLCRQWLFLCPQRHPLCHGHHRGR